MIICVFLGFLYLDFDGQNILKEAENNFLKFFLNKPYLLRGSTIPKHQNTILLANICGGIDCYCMEDEHGKMLGQHIKMIPRYIIAYLGQCLFDTHVLLYPFMLRTDTV